jgi:hypothetical protein
LYSAGEEDEGAAFAFLGSASGIADGNPATADAQLYGNQEHAWLGGSVASAGDVNGDDYDDVIVGVAGDGAESSQSESAEGRALISLGSPEEYPCNDNLDNDGDGLTDFPADPGCGNPYGMAENPQCNDGVDNDGDTLIDYPNDPSCLSAYLDDEAWVFNPSCGLGIELTLVLAPLLLVARRGGQ